MESQVPGMGVSSGGGSLSVKAHCKEHPCPQPGRAPGAQELSAVGYAVPRSQKMFAGSPLERIIKKSTLVCFQEAEYNHG